MRRILALCLCGLLLAAPVPVRAARRCTVRVERAAGGSWETRLIGGLRGEPYVWHLTADEGDPRFAAVADAHGIVVTRDGGCTWERVAEYAEFVAPLIATPIDAVVAGSGPDRSLHVLIGRWMWAEPGPTLLSSYDDGESWTAVTAPAPAGPYNFVSYSLTASPSSPRVVYLLTGHSSATGAVYAGSGRDDWRRQSTTAFAAPESCVPGDACLARTIAVLQADPARRDVLWAAAGPTLEPDSTLGHSADGGRSWKHDLVPDLLSSRPLLDVSPNGTVTMVGGHSRYAMSRDGGRSWAVGRLPEVVSGDSTNVSAFQLAHFDRGRAVATVLGSSASAGWAGNVLVFAGSRWRDASPHGFAGYDRGVTFAALASTHGPLLALTSRGELMSFRP